MSSNFDYPFQRGTESLPIEPNQRLGGVRPSGNEVNDEYYQEVIERNSSLIDMFIRQSRQEANLSGLDSYYNSGQYPEFDITYIRQFGKEHVNVSPKPKRPRENIPMLEPIIIPDIMLDGYLAVLVYNAKLPESWTYTFPNAAANTIGYSWYETSFEIILNDEVIYTYQNNFNEVRLIVFTFGDNALRCHSYRDDFNPNNLLNFCLPSRIDGDSELSPVLPAYILFDRLFMNALSAHNIDLAYTLDGIDNLQAYSRSDSGVLPIEIEYIGLDLSVLNEVEDNEIFIQSNKRTPEDDFTDFSINGRFIKSRSTNPNVAIFGEFFDRNPETFRYVDQSWNFHKTVNTQYHVNDKPMYFFAGAKNVDNIQDQNIFIAEISWVEGSEDDGGDQKRWLKWSFNLSSKVVKEYSVTIDTFGLENSVYDAPTPSPETPSPFEGVYSSGFKYMTDDQFITTYNVLFTLDDPQPPAFLYTGTTHSGVGREPLVYDRQAQEYKNAYTQVWVNYHLGETIANNISNWNNFLNMFRDILGTVKEDEFLKE